MSEVRTHLPGRGLRVFLPCLSLELHFDYHSKLFSNLFYILLLIYYFKIFSKVVQMIKNLPTMQKTWAGSLGWEDSLEKGMAVHYSIFAWRIP